MALLSTGCGGSQGGVEAPEDLPDVDEAPDPGQRVDPDADPDEQEETPEASSSTFATRFTMSTTLSLGARGYEVLCPDPQVLEIRGTFLSTSMVEEGRTHEAAQLCSLELPSFLVSDHGAIGGCDETRAAQIKLGFDVADVARPSDLAVPTADAGSLPVAFVMGAALRDPFADELPSWNETERYADDDGDGNPGITLTGHGLPVLPEGAHLYAAARLLVTPLDDEGSAEASLELSLLGSDAGLSGRTLELLAPDLRAGLVVDYERVELDSATTCDAIPGELSPIAR
ncbi:MAG: hypothetical protein HYY06_18660 [Deltaproteobacteria bacterium]|nr:hypothetical protein [Deltaproteobacteria bacterium]